MGSVLSTAKADPVVEAPSTVKAGPVTKVPSAAKKRQMRKTLRYVKKAPKHNESQALLKLPPELTHHIFGLLCNPAIMRVYSSRRFYRQDISSMISSSTSQEWHNCFRDRAKEIQRYHNKPFDKLPPLYWLLVCK